VIAISASSASDTNHMFNSFLCIFLNIFQAGLPLQYRSIRDKDNRITHGIKISCKHKSNLCALTKNSDDPKAKAHYVNCSKIVRKIIKKAKKQHCSRL